MLSDCSRSNSDSNKNSQRYLQYKSFASMLRVQDFHVIPRHKISLFTKIYLRQTSLYVAEVLLQMILRVRVIKYSINN